VPVDEIVNEATLLCEVRHVKELVLVAQDTTRYGCDNGSNLVTLIQKLSKIKTLSWIRLLYCYPNKIDDALICEIKNNPKVVKYIDMPLQHISDNVLKNMQRREKSKMIKALIKKLRHEIPDLKIRSTFMVGFPGETEKDVKTLTKFLKKYKLDNVGFFKYSREEGTASFDYEGQISEEEKDKRLKIVGLVQHTVATKQNKKYVGKTFKVLVDSYDARHKFFVGRAYFMAPDVDFEILFKPVFSDVKVGNFADVEIVDYDENGYFIGRQVEHRDMCL